MSTPENNSRVLAIFDFDNTLTTSDSFRLFSNIAAGNMVDKAYVLGLAICSKLGILSNCRYKELVLDRVWSQRNEHDQMLFVEYLLERIRKIERKSIVDRLSEHLDRGDTVAVVSASPEFYLVPFVHNWSEKIQVYGSRIAADAGGISLTNLYGADKARVARRIIEDCDPDEVWVYTDHISDLTLLSLASKACLVSPPGILLKAVRALGKECETIS